MFRSLLFFFNSDSQLNKITYKPLGHISKNITISTYVYILDKKIKLKSIKIIYKLEAHQR